jgi:SpoVK/Ycf46/Vps4 family AAA+-type ATPase
VDLVSINKFIGISQIKSQVCDQIMYLLQKFHGEKEMMHSLIIGPPGTGKSKLAKKLAKIYLKLGVVKSDVFINAKRSDLIAKYAGQTAIKTQDVINSALGGVLLIDEAYSLGTDGNDSYSKECIDTINRNLTEHAGEFICIVVGYEAALNKSFFAYNEGLRSRFTHRYRIDKYSYGELTEIFNGKVIKNEWSTCIRTDDMEQFIKQNYDCFKYYGRDMETLFHKTKIMHSKRVFNCASDQKKVIIMDDVNSAFDRYFKDRSDSHSYDMSMYS